MVRSGTLVPCIGLFFGLLFGLNGPESTRRRAGFDMEDKA